MACVNSRLSSSARKRTPCPEALVASRWERNAAIRKAIGPRERLGRSDEIADWDRTRTGRRTGIGLPNAGCVMTWFGLAR